MGSEPSPSPARRRRLAEELAEAGYEPDGDERWTTLVLDEVDHALRPPVHERRIASVGTILEPRAAPETWSHGTDLEVTLRPIGDLPLTSARRFADGLSSWLVRRLDGADELAVFDRPAGSERDLVVIARSIDATIVQRHPNGSVRVVGPFGVVRWEAQRWRREPPISSWIDGVAACWPTGERDVLERLLAFAVHDLGARGIGAILVIQPDGVDDPSFQLRLPRPPPLDVRHATDLAPLRHALSQVDGAAVFDATGVLRQLGVQLVSSPEAESTVEGYRGMRHTSGRRYSFDEPGATVIVVSEDGPVTVLRDGELLGASPRPTA